MGRGGWISANKQCYVNLHQSAPSSQNCEPLLSNRVFLTSNGEFSLSNCAPSITDCEPSLSLSSNVSPVRGTLPAASLLPMTRTALLPFPWSPQGSNRYQALARK